MAINRLTDIVSVFESKWTYGDSKFEYDFEINQDHDIQYPVLQIEPPTSIIPEIYNGREEYEFEINFYNLYSQGAQSAVALQQRWDNLQDLALEWLDMVLKHYQDASVEAYLNDESIEIERLKEVANDKLVQLKLTFTMSAFTKCFRPVSHYPSDFSDLVIWLSADSNVGFSIPTKKVETWGDKSGNNNNVSQTDETLQPKRYSYAEETTNSSTNEGQFNDKTRIAFPNNSTDYLECDTVVNTPLSSGDFTVFVVAAYNTDVSSTQESVFTSEPIVPTAGQIELGQRYLTSYQAIVSDGTNSITANVASSPTEAITCYKLSGDTLTLYANGVAGTPITTAGFDATGKFIVNKWYIGAIPTIATSAFNGGVAEIVVYDSVLSDSDREKVDEYLNNKYKIY